MGSGAGPLCPRQEPVGGQSCSSGILELRGFASAALATFERDLAYDPHARNRAGLRDVTFPSGRCGLV